LRGARCTVSLSYSFEAGPSAGGEDINCML